MIDVYVINLARSPERRAWMERELTKAGVAGTFVRAIDGRRFGGRCEPWLRSRNPLRPLTRAEAALTLSHRKAWRKFLASGAEHAVVLEDDVHLGEGFCDALALDWTRWRFDVVKFETMFDRVWLSRRGETAGARRLHRLGAEHHGSAAYLISRAGARKLLAATRDFELPVDIDLFGRTAIGRGLVVALQLVPAIAVQHHLHPCATRENALASTLQDSRGEAGAARKRDKPKGLERLRREARRLGEQAIRFIRLAPTQHRRRIPFV